MPGLARKIIVCASIDGLFIQPLSSKSPKERPAQSILLRYGDAAISRPSKAPDYSKADSYFEAFGIVGLVTVSRQSYLITIIRRQQIAQIYGTPIYMITEVAVTPCTSQSEAQQAVAQTSAHCQNHAEDDESDDSGSDDTIDLQAHGMDEVEDPTEQEAQGSVSPGRPRAKSTVAEDVIGRKGSYGRFAQRWFSKTGWMQGQKRSAGWSDTTSDPPAAAAAEGAGMTASKISIEEEDETLKSNRASTLLPKLLRTIRVLFGSSRSFFFSYDYDITRHWASRATAPPKELPLYQQVDPEFFWNKHISQPFIDRGQDALILPLMQGFVGQKQFIMDGSPPQNDEVLDSMEMSDMALSTSLPGSPPPEKIRESIDLRPSEKRLLITVISRRSTKRAGLRYLRRGVNEDGYVANAVETEQILSNAAWDTSTKIYSFLQIRGSIPLFFTQSPYSLKPAPVLQHAQRANLEACQKHFERLTKDYGALQIVNLVEKGNVEAQLGTKYQDTVRTLNEEVFNGHHAQIPFEWFDFHAACRGMKFENVSLLLDKMRDKLEQLGSTIEKDGELFLRQRGVLRTNCMDCLDRTNVCQSSFAKYMLECQLRTEGYELSAQQDQELAWFNNLWADNGDAVSKQYASTAAMKGDFTRTAKRNLRGQLIDISLSLTRFYNGMVNDYFSQAAIDFLLGNVTSMVFQEFETDMMTKDPAVSMLRMRQQAIELCRKRVISDETEEMMGSWVLLSPPTSDTVKSPLPFEEVVLLLTDVALYLCRFDWSLDKVSSFERVDLGHVRQIRFGTYITSTISPSHLDEAKNVGFIVTYQPGKSDIQRMNTRTFSSKFAKNSGATAATASGSNQVATVSGLVSLFSGGGRSGTKTGPPQVPAKRIAFKAPYSQSSAAVTSDGPRLSEIQQVVSICAEIERLAFKCQPGKELPGTESILEKGDVISLEEARQSTSVLDHLSHSIKKLVWAT